MGRHTTPGTGSPDPDRGFWVRLGVAAVVGLLVGGFLLTRGGDDDATTTARPGGASTTTPPDNPAMSASTPLSSPTTNTATSPAMSAAATASGRPRTLRFVVLRKAYITVRIPGGRTLVSRLFPKGASRSFDQKTLQVVNGRPSAVRFTVNGRPHKPGPAAQTEIFTVRRR